MWFWREKLPDVGKTEQGQNQTRHSKIKWFDVAWFQGVTAVGLTPLIFDLSGQLTLLEKFHA